MDDANLRPSAMLLDGRGGGRTLEWEEVGQWRPKHGVLWVHLDHTDPDTPGWLTDEAKLEELTVEALTASSDSSYPRRSPASARSDASTAGSTWTSICG